MRKENLETAKNLNFIFCSHPLNKKSVDEDYMEEYQAAGLNHSCALFSYEDLEVGKLSLYGEDIKGLTIYRGWMMSPNMYENFYNLLLERGIQLINTPKEYAKYHLLPGWYKDFERCTPFSIWSESKNIQDVLKLTDGLEGAFIIKDYVKSRKHEWYDACFIKDIRDKENTERVINNFINRQDSNLEGGIVLRKFESLKSIGNHKDSGMPISEEYRIFVFKGEILIANNYWNDSGEVNITEDEYTLIESIISKIESSFITIDFARKTDGNLIIMEMGDGQVSGLQQMDEYEFYGAFQNQGK
nr:ATP-grasp domain-containing protein [uncultured Lachnoanaerobaculum sp.]